MYATSALCYTRKSAQLSSILTSTQKNILDQITTAIRQAEKNTEYHSQYASIYAPFDIKIKTEIGAQASKVGIIDYLVVIGIGGSSLGFRAVYDALQDQTILKKDQICILETVDTPSVLSALNSIEALLIQQVRVHISVISKSGSTIETLALWYTVQQLLEKYHKNNWNQQVTIITDTGSPLELYAHTHGIKVLTIPQLVGGRYSVFSPAGLFPLALCGLELDTLLQGARDAITALHNTQAVQTTMTIQHAIAIFSAYQRNYQVHDTFIFSTWCKTIGLWYRQLSAESLGKKDIYNKKIISMIPTVSIGSTDLHSIGQLYLSGAHNFWTTFITIKDDIIINASKNNTSYGTIVPFLHNRPLNEIMSIIEQSTMDMYTENEIPYSHISLTTRSPYTIGYLMQSYMLAIMYAAGLLEINPFDQPDIERYKKMAYQLLLKNKKDV